MSPKLQKRVGLNKLKTVSKSEKRRVHPCCFRSTLDAVMDDDEIMAVSHSMRLDSCSMPMLVIVVVIMYQHLVGF